jgi:uncharacterized protein (DUF1697 family)
MKYVALLRGINVGGNSIIKMAGLKEAAEKCGFSNVRTFIQSGNVIFESVEKDNGKLSAKLEDCFSKNYSIESQAIILTEDQFRKVVGAAPEDWKTRDDLRRYIAFVRPPITPEDLLKEIKLKEDVDFVRAGAGVLYMSTLLSGITKSGFTKLVGTKVYKDITIRNYTTVHKLLELLEQ